MVIKEVYYCCRTDSNKILYSIHSDEKDMGIINKRKLSLVTEDYFVFASKLIFFLLKKITE